MRLIVIFIICSSIASCNKPYGQNEMVAEELADSVVYPELDEVQDSDDPFQYYRLAKLNYNQGNSSKALAYAKRAVELDDQNALYYYLLAQVYAALDETDEALDNALKSYSLGYVNPELQVLISQQYYADEQFDKGKRFLDVAVNKRPNDPEVAFLKAKMLLQQEKDTVRAVEWINKTLSLDSNFTEALERKAQIFIAQDNIEEAINILERLYELERHNIENQYTLGTLLMNIEEYEEAAKWFKSIIKVDSSHLTSFLQLSVINLTQRQYDSTRHYAGIALQYDSAFNDARLLIARSYDRQYRYSDALEVYQNIVERDSTFEIAVIEMEQLLKKIAYLRRVREKQDTAKTNTPSPVQNIKNSDDQND